MNDHYLIVTTYNNPYRIGLSPKKGLLNGIKIMYLKEDDFSLSSKKLIISLHSLFSLNYE